MQQLRDARHQRISPGERDTRYIAVVRFPFVDPEPHLVHW